MNVLRWISRGLLLVIASITIAMWIGVVTLNMTLLNRQAVLSWLEASGAYSHLADSVVSLQAPEGEESTVNTDALKQAISNTLTPSFVRQSSEKVVNAVFDWVEGQTPSIKFSISLADKREVLQQQLATALEPELAKLPACSNNSNGLLNRQDPQCLPKGSNPKTAASSAAQQTVDSSDFLTQPITAASLGGLDTSSMAWLPAIVQNFGWLAFVLPAVAALCITGYVLLSSVRLRGLRTAAGHIFFGTTFATLAGAAMWFFGGTIHFADALGDSTNIALLTDVIEPIMHQAIPAIGMWLTFVAGGTWLVAGATWITLLILHKGKEQDLPEPEPAPRHEPKTHVEEEAPKEPVEPAPYKDEQPKPPAQKPPTPSVGHM